MHNQPFHVYDSTPECPVTRQDAINRRVCQLRATIMFISADGIDNFTAMKTELQEDYLWLMGDLVEELDRLIRLQWKNVTHKSVTPLSSVALKAAPGAVCNPVTLVTAKTDLQEKSVFSSERMERGVS